MVYEKEKGSNAEGIYFSGERERETEKRICTSNTKRNETNISHHHIITYSYMNERWDT